jgi:hypothetical protein
VVVDQTYRQRYATQSRCYCGSRNSRTINGQASHHDYSNRNDSCGRPVGEWTRCQSGAARRQRHRHEPDGAGPRGQATRVAKRGSAPTLPRGRALECGQSVFRAGRQRDAGRRSDIGDRDGRSPMRSARWFPGRSFALALRHLRRGNLWAQNTRQLLGGPRREALEYSFRCRGVSGTNDCCGSSGTKTS